ncbi:MAG TPA: hypothetical protein VFG10_02850 [Saprospiraceae bacterium]|nr:hypothetical protein [Saprospiraceae bacterium]
MSPKHFFAGLAITSIAQISIILLLMLLFAPLKQHTGFVVVTIAAMILFCTLLFGAAKVYARSTFAKLYIQLIMLAVFLKMLLCVALIIGYQKGFEPPDISFIWPFLVIYLTSTIYEVIFLEKVGREKQSSSS